jgi:CHAD domain-containing protein
LTALELVLAPDDAARVPRLKFLAGLKAGRLRRRAIEIVWHDTADGALALEGLALAESRGTWRLERLVPGTAFWPPGAPAPLVEQHAALDRIGHELPAGLVRTARFAGELTILPLVHDGAHLTLELLHGTVGWARKRRPACRMTLVAAAPVGHAGVGAPVVGEAGAGEAGTADAGLGDPAVAAEAAVFALAQALADELDLAVPTASLAAEARAVATASVAAVRHEGAPHLPPGLTVAEAFGFVLGHLADVILYNAPLAAAGRDGPEPVHEMRVAVRRLRSAIALFRPAVGCPAVDSAAAGLKALADRLGPARDWDVFVAETAAAVGKVLPDDASLRRLRAAAERRRRQAYAALRDWLGGVEFRRLGLALAGLAGGRAWQAVLDPEQAETLGLSLEAFASRALARRLHRLAAAGEAIEHLDTKTLHAIRLRAKRMRYVAEVFAPLYPGKATRRFMRRLARLQDRLGRLNDSSVADALLAEMRAGTGGRAHAAGLVRGFLAAGSRGARGRIARAWARFHRLEPFWS